MKPGCLPSAQRDLDRRLRLEDYLTAAPPPAPPEKDYTDIGQVWDKFANDECGDCAVAAAANAIRLAQYWAKVDVPITRAAALDAYKDLTRYDVNAQKPDPALDTGVDMAKVLKYWRSKGFAGQRCDKYLAFDYKEPASWRTAIYLFGFAYVGFALPDSIVKAADDKNYISWDATDPPNPANGHCAIVAGYSASGLKVVSWGTVIPMSWDFARRYVDPKNEAYAVLLPLWAIGNPNALNLKQLEKDLKEVQADGAAPAQASQPVAQKPPETAPLSGT